MRAATNTEFAAVSLTIAQGLGTGIALLPSLSDVRNGSLDDDHLRIAVRHAEAMVTVITLSTGTVGAVMLKSPFPLYAAIAILTALVLSYELTLRMQVNYSEGYNND